MEHPRALPEPGEVADRVARAVGAVEPTPLLPGAVLLRGVAEPLASALADALRPVIRQAPWRHLQTPGGRRMAVATSNCGALGWVSDARGYRYTPNDPATGEPWPAMPPLCTALATAAAAAAGFPGFVPDACLVNRYRPGIQLGLHQDRDEASHDHPIVSVSLGLPAVFVFGGIERGGRTLRLTLDHGDVLVWGGPARLRFHGVRPLADGHHPFAGDSRINLTLRRAG